MLLTNKLSANAIYLFRGGKWNIIQFDSEILPHVIFEIKQVKARELESLVGNIGGYIGLLLGYVILSLPSIFFDLFRFARKRSSDRKTSK